MIPSFINVILCLLILLAQLFGYELPSGVYLTLIGVVLVFNAISFAMAICRKNIAKEQLRILKELLGNFNKKSNSNNLNEHLKLLTEEVSKVNQLSNTTRNKSFALKEQIHNCIANLRNINKILNYINEKNFQQIKELIKQHNRISIETLAEQAKISFSYKTHYDEQPVKTYDGYLAAVYLSDALENFIISAWLKQQGLKVQTFSAVSDFSAFDLVVCDDSKELEFERVLYLSNHQQKDGFLKRPFDRMSFLQAASVILDTASKGFKITNQATLPSNDALIFMPNSLLNSQMLHEMNKHAGANKTVNSLSEFKRELASDFKIIVLDAECVRFDYEAVKILLNEAKLRNSKLFVMVFCEQKSRESFEFADWIIKDAPQAQIVEMIKKHL